MGSGSSQVDPQPCEPKKKTLGGRGRKTTNPTAETSENDLREYQLEIDAAITSLKAKGRYNTS